MNLRFTKAVILFTLLMLFGCKQTLLTSDPLNNTSWILDSLYDHPPLDGTTITLEFSKGHVRGNSGCNDYFWGEYASEKYPSSEAGSLTISDSGITIVGCLPDEIMDQEETYMKALRTVAGYRLTKDQLELKNGTGDTILVFTSQSLSGLPYLVGSVLAGGVAIYLWWFLLKKPVSSQKAG
jgi:heat shock protein HslJ